MKKINKQKNFILISFLSVPLIMLLLFVVFPTGKLFQMSITDWDGSSISYNYIGLKNFIKIFTSNKEVWKSLSNNGIYFVVHVAAIPVMLIVSALLTNKIRGMSFFKTIVFLPYVINGVAVAYIFSFFFSPVNGGFNSILTMLGLEGWIQNWLSSEKLVNFTLASISLWKYCGMHCILYIAGIQSIPRDLYEAATVDGAGTMQQFWYITLPNIRRVLEISLFLNVRGALQVFDIPFLVTGGGPGYASSTFTLHTINTAFKYNSFGLASAMGVILLFLIILLSALQQKLMQAKKF